MSGSPAESFASGQRIKARATTTITTTADGATRTVKTFGGWFDSTRNEACSPTLASDGKTRCIPQAGAIADAPSLFIDTACSIPVTFVTGCTEAPKYVAMQPPVTCPQVVGARVFAAGTPSTTYYVKSGANCNGPNSIPGFTAYPPSGAEIPAATFAEVTVTTTTQ